MKKPYIVFKNTNQLSWESTIPFTCNSKDNREQISIVKYLIQINGHPKALEATFTSPITKHTHVSLTNNLN